MPSRSASSSRGVRLYYRPASAKTGLHVVSEATLKSTHIALYGMPHDSTGEQLYLATKPGEPTLGDKAVAALQSSFPSTAHDVPHVSVSLHASSVAATLAIAQLDALRPVSLLKNSARFGVDALPRSSSSFDRVHPSFFAGDADAWVRVDTTTGYLWREVRDPDVMRREAAFYRFLHQSSTVANTLSSGGSSSTEHLLTVLGNDTRYVAVEDGLRAPHYSRRAAHRPRLLRSASSSSHKPTHVPADDPGAMYRSLLFVVTEPYRCTLAQALAESRKEAQKATSTPPLSATDVVTFLRDVLEQLAALHAAGITHNMLHPELVCIAPKRVGDFDRVTRFARGASQLAALRKTRSAAGTSVHGSETASVASYGATLSSLGQRDDSNKEDSSTGGGGMSPASDALTSLVTMESSPLAAAAKPKKQPQRVPMLSDLTLCCGKLMDLSCATVFVESEIPKLEAFTLTAQRRDPASSSYRILPSLPPKALEFATPPEWCVSIRVPKGPKRALLDLNAMFREAARRQASLALLAPPQNNTAAVVPPPLLLPESEFAEIAPNEESEVLTRRLDRILPQPSSDVYLFGHVVSSVFSVANEARQDEFLPPDLQLNDARGYMSHVDYVGAAECAHFVEQATLAIPARRLTVAQCLAHPFFWTAPVAASFVSALAEFLASPRAAKPATDALTAAARGRANTAQKVQEAVSGTSPKSPAEVAGCSKDLLRWASVVITTTSGEPTAAPTTITHFAKVTTHPSHRLQHAGEPTKGAVAAALASGVDDRVVWLNHVKDWYEAVCQDNVPGVRYDYENTARDQMMFLANVYVHVKAHGTLRVCDGDESRLVLEFLHSRFPGSLIAWLKRLCKNPADGERFLAFIQAKGRVEVPHSAAIICGVQRFVMEQRTRSAERLRAYAEAYRSRDHFSGSKGVVVTRRGTLT